MGNQTHNNQKLIYSLDKSTKDISNLANHQKLLVQNNSLNNIEETKLLIVLILFNEVSRSESGLLIRKGKSSSNLRTTVLASCSRTIMALRTTKSRAMAYITSATNDFIKAHPDCKKVFGIDSGCLWGDYGCVATQELSCSGGGCDVSYGSL